MQRVAQKSFGHGLRRGAFEAARPAAASSSSVQVADDAAGGIHAHIEFFLLQGAKKSRLPVPDVDFGRHHLIGFLRGRLRARGKFWPCRPRRKRCWNRSRRAARPGRRQIAWRLFQRGRAGNFEVNGGFGERPEEILVRHARAEEAGENPDQKNSCVLSPLSRSSGNDCLRWRRTSSRVDPTSMAPSFPMRQAIASIGAGIGAVVPKR